jgi:enoyl-CoA hydratase/carnithine racemase
MPLVTTEDRGAVRHVVLDRPEKRNAMHAELVLAIGDALRAAARDPDVLCVVLRGAGPMFSAGMDVASLGALVGAPEGVRAFRDAALAAWNVAEEMTKPVVAQIHGACLGGAVELALACDLRVMADDAVMGLVETRIGLVPDLGGCARLPAVVGLGRAKELVMTARTVGAAEAERIGLVNRVVPAENLLDEALGLAERIAANSPFGITLTKRVLTANVDAGSLRNAVEVENRGQTLATRGQDFSESLGAFREKREPKFSGR